MADLEFFFDPVCPFAYITSRWVVEVQQQRDYEIIWRPISLAFLNENVDDEWYTPEYRGGHLLGLKGLRIAVALGDNDAVGRFYTAVGDVIHRRRGREQLEAGEQGWAQVLTAAGLDPAVAAACNDDAYDAAIRASTDLALQRTGPDVGTPILTFHPGAVDENSFFGPVISSIPRGDEALRLWDAVELIATTSGMSELKRSSRAKLDFT
ncbi:MAG TPA: DsbA family protein [Ilumatobacteraceae bacterium]|nr:DsbA family protein [Ilumatobacteraceae bacterium]